MSCKHSTQKRVGDAMWCRYCGAIRETAAGEWQLPAKPREPQALITSVRDQLMSVVTGLDSIIIPPDEDTPLP